MTVDLDSDRLNSLSLNESGSSPLQPLLSNAPGNPVQVLTFQASIAGVVTEFLFTEYANMFQLIITQTGKMGSLYMATVDAPPLAVSLAAETYSPPTSVKCLLGQRNNVLEISYASRLVILLVKSRLQSRGTEQMHAKPLLLGLSLKDHGALFDEYDIEDKGLMEERTHVFQTVIDILNQGGVI